MSLVRVVLAERCVTTEAVHELSVPLVLFVLVDRCVAIDAVVGLLVHPVSVVLVDRCVAIDAVDELLVTRLRSCLSGVFPTVELREQTEDDDNLLASIVACLSCFSSENPA